MLCTSYVFSEHFYTSPYGLTEVLTRTSMLIKEPSYTNSQIYSHAEYLSDGLSVSAPIRPFLRTGLRTGLRTWSGPNDWSQLIRFSVCSADSADVELVSQHSPSSSA